MPRLPAELLDVRHYPFKLLLSTRFGDVDQNGHVNNVAMAGLFEDARFRFISSINVRRRITNLRMVIASAHIEYLAESFYPHPIEMHVGLISIGRSSWSVAELALQNGKICGFCRATLVRVDQDGPTPWPEGFHVAMQSFMLREPVISPRIPACASLRTL